MLAVLGIAFVLLMNNQFTAGGVVKSLFCGSGGTDALGKVASGSPESLAARDEFYGRISMLLFCIITCAQFFAFALAWMVTSNIKNSIETFKLRLQKLENADIFFDVPLYVGLFGTVSAFLVMIFPFLLAFSVKAKEKNAKILTRALLLIFIACIIFTWSRAAWIALIVGTLIFALICKRKAFRIFGAAILVVPILPIVIPTSIIQRFLSIANLADSSIAYRIYTWQGTLNAIKDYWFCGIGYGDSAFQAIYPSYSYSGIEATPHSHSLILQILLCMGIVGFIIFCIAIFLNFQKSFEFIKVTNNPSTSIYVIASAVSIISALIIGVFDYIWYNPRLFYLFWIIIAIGCAFIRMSDYEKARREEFQHY